VLDVFLIIKGHVNVDASETKDKAFYVLVVLVLIVVVVVVVLGVRLRLRIALSTNPVDGLDNFGAIFVPLPEEALGARGFVFLYLDGAWGLEGGIGILVEQSKELDEGISEKDGLGVREFVVVVVVRNVEAAIVRRIGILVLVAVAIAVTVVITMARVGSFGYRGTIHVRPTTRAASRATRSGSAILLATSTARIVCVVILLSSAISMAVSVAVAPFVEVLPSTPGTASSRVGVVAAGVAARGSLLVAVVAAATTTTPEMRRHVSTSTATRHCDK